MTEAVTTTETTVAAASETPAPAATLATGTTTEATATATETAKVGDGGTEFVAPARPEGLDEALWDPQANAPKWTDVTARLARAAELEAAETARSADVPAKPEDYKLDIVGDPIPGLDGKPVAIDPKDPMAQAILAVAAKEKIPQGQMSALTRAYAEAQVQGAKQLQESVKAETAKLGEKAPERIQAVVNFVKQHGGEEGDDLIKALYSASAVVALEKIMAAAGQMTVGSAQGQGAPNPNIIDTWFKKSMGNKAA